MAEATSLSCTDTVFSADAIEFSPDPNIFACGTYQIEKDESAASQPAPDDDGVVTEPTVSRFGRCLLYEVDRDGTNLFVDDSLASKTFLSGLIPL